MWVGWNIEGTAAQELGVDVGGNGFLHVESRRVVWWVLVVVQQCFFGRTEALFWVKREREDKVHMFVSVLLLIRQFVWEQGRLAGICWDGAVFP